MWVCWTRSTSENAWGLTHAPLPWTFKVYHVHSASPEPKCLVGKVPSVHLSKNINKSHHCELITKSQVACIKKTRGVGGWQLELASAAEICRNGLDLCWQKTWDKPLSDLFTGCYTHTYAFSTVYIHKYHNSQKEVRYRHLCWRVLEC